VGWSPPVPEESSDHVIDMTQGVGTPPVIVGAAVALVHGGTERMEEKTLLHPTSFKVLSWN